MPEENINEFARTQAIAYFDEIKDFLPRNEQGEVDISKLKEKLINLDMNSNIAKYIVSIFPEFFLRGNNILTPYFRYFAPEGSEFQNILQGDFSFLKKYDEVFPMVHELATLLSDESIVKMIKQVINQYIFSDNSFLKSVIGDGVDKYPKVLQDLMQWGCILENNHYQDIAALRKKIKLNPNDGYLKYAIKASALYDMAYRRDMWKDNCGYDLEDIFSKEKAREISQEYRKKYAKVIHDFIFPRLAQFIKERAKKENRNIGDMDSIMSIIAEREYQEGKEDYHKIDNVAMWFSGLKYETFEKSMASFFNPIITVAGIPQAFLDFEQLENKDLFSTLNIIRNTLGKVPVDNDSEFVYEVHGALKNELRTGSIYGDGLSSMVMECTPPPEEILPNLEKLNKIFGEMMMITDLDKYINCVALLYDSMIRIHPYRDGNGRTTRYLIRILLAHRGIILPALYRTNGESLTFLNKVDNAYYYNFSQSLENSAISAIADKFKKIGIDITGQNRLGNEKVEQNDNTKENQDDDRYGGDAGGKRI